MTNMNFSVSLEFLNDLKGLAPAVKNHALSALLRMNENIWAPEMHPEKVKGAESGIYSSRADDSYRIIWKYIKPIDVVLLLIDQHDPAYRRASRKSFTLENGFLRIRDTLTLDATSYTGRDELFGFPSGREKSIGELFIGYSDAEIMEWGVPEEVFPNIRALNNVNQLDAIARLVPQPVFDHMCEIALGIIERPTVPDNQLTASITQNQGGEDVYRFIDSDEFKRVLEGKIEDWLLFLAPHQKAIVQREFTGPARIKGVSGSGKTVVAIHRARQLAQRIKNEDANIIFLTYGNRLPEVNRHLLTQLVGEDSVLLSRIECKTIHQWCSQFLRSCGEFPKVYERQAEEILSNAITETMHDMKVGNNLARRDTNFFADEIRYVIKGKELRHENDYLELERSGRGTRLSVDERRVVWQIYQKYQSGMNEANLCDYDDFILHALDFVREGKLAQCYQFAIVDEIQDLSEATLKLVRAIVAPGANDLFLVGDGMQKIYPGGYSLNRVGIDITGRGTILRKNYRNTQQILQVAQTMMGNIQFDDLDEELVQNEIPEYSVRQGPIPKLTVFPTIHEEINWVKNEIERLIGMGTYSEKDFALVYRWANPYKDMIASNIGNEYQVVELTKDAETYFGAGIKLSTFHSVKGLEFKVVFLVGVTDGLQVPRDSSSLADDEMEDYLLREKRLLYVAMTRARDLLYITCGRGQPSRFLNNIPKQMLQLNRL